MCQTFPLKFIIMGYCGHLIDFWSQQIVVTNDFFVPFHSKSSITVVTISIHTTLVHLVAIALILCNLCGHKFEQKLVWCS
jgi:hypothetical protein